MPALPASNGGGDLACRHKVLGSVPGTGIKEQTILDSCLIYSRFPIVLTE